MNVEVVLHRGLWHLVINGVYLATEGDIVRDPDIEGRTWSKRGLELAAALIREQRWKSAAHRFAEGDEPRGLGQ